VPQIYLCKAQLTVIEEVPTSRLYISALTIGLSYFLGGLIPLLPYLFATSAEQGLIISCIVTGVVLLLFGAFKTYFTYVPLSFSPCISENWAHWQWSYWWSWWIRLRSDIDSVCRWYRRCGRIRARQNLGPQRRLDFVFWREGFRISSTTLAIIYPGPINIDSHHQ
jgi:hypothetical protein